MSRMLRMDDSLQGSVRRYLRPAAQLSGDALIAAKTPANVVHVTLVSAGRGGLASAINVLPVCRAFYELTEQGFSIVQIASDLNDLVTQIMPEDRFVSMALLSINTNTQAIEVWNGGIPALHLLRRDGTLLHAWLSKHSPLGVLSGKQFSAKPEIYHYDEDCQLYLFSEGAQGACCSGAPAHSGAAIGGLLADLPVEGRYDALIKVVEGNLNECDSHGDVSIAMMEIPANVCRVAEVQDDAGSAENEPGNWRVAIRLGASELKYLDVVPLLTQLLTKMRTAREHHSALFLILSELFNNALDHGVLRLDSRLKSGGEGFEQYLQLREERMRALEHGEISLEVESAVVDGLNAVKIHVTDSGEGFDCMAEKSSSGEAQFGRGIALTRSLTHKLEYVGRGNEVIAYYACV